MARKPPGFGKSPQLFCWLVSSCLEGPTIKLGLDPDRALSLQLSLSLRTRVMPRTLSASWMEVGIIYLVHHLCCDVAINVVPGIILGYRSVHCPAAEALLIPAIMRW